MSNFQFMYVQILTTFFSPSRLETNQGIVGQLHLETHTIMMNDVFAPVSIMVMSKYSISGNYKHVGRPMYGMVFVTLKLKIHTVRLVNWL